ncbi:MAG: 2-oxo acid dehydrogenase subunit E2 [Clostridiaceae bacterium]|nr:2-oxo acid dehydrogenase subunit E2 [Clostridiaceae bacterium]
MCLGKKRKDGKLVTDGDPMNHIMPYMMRSRNESIIYYQNSIEVKPIRDYIKKRRKQGDRITMFNILMASILNIFVLRPKLNRFIAGRRIYEHNGYEGLYIVKLDLSDQAYESIAKVTMTEDDNINTVAEKMKAQVELIRKAQEEKTDDKLISYFSKTPRWFLRFALATLRWLDFHGWMPKTLTDIIPLYSSVFLSHLGSIGGNAPFHHLYEFGTNSLFITMGKIYEKPFKSKNGEVEWREVIDLVVSIDERICDGYYLIKSLSILENYFETPELLEISPRDMFKYIDSKDISFGNRKLTISDKIKQRLGIEEIAPRQYHLIFEDEDLVDTKSEN